MTERLTDQSIQQMLELEAKATSAPWDFYYATGETAGIIRYEENGEYREYLESVMPVFPKKDKDLNNIQLVTAIRNAVRPLLEEVVEARKLRTQVSYADSECSCRECLICVEHLEQQLTQAKEQLREAVAALERLKSLDDGPGIVNQIACQTLAKINKGVT
jgi:hypothetical protein